MEDILWKISPAKESLLADDELHLHRGMWAPTVQLPR